MCDPTTLFIASQVAATTIGIAQQRATAKAQNKVFEANKLIAQKEAARQFSEVDTRILQERRAAAQRLQSIAEQSSKALGQSIVSAGEGGVAGNSVQILFNEFVRQNLESKFRIGEQLEDVQNQLQQNKKAIQANLERQVLSSAPTTSSPGALASLLLVGNTFLSAKSSVDLQKTNAGIE